MLSKPSSHRLNLALAALVTAVLSACGGGGSGGADTNGASGGGSSAGNGSQYTYTPYACDAARYAQAKQLRIYQVMVEAFVDADSAANAELAYGPSHHKGDIAGITASLDYIKGLGMNAIWLTPVFHSVEISGQDEWADRLDGTGYFASNYFAVDPKFGTLEQLRTLVETAHAKGLYVFFDGVFGHFKNNAHEFPSPEGRRLSTSGPAQGTTGREAVYPDDLAFFKEVATYWIRELKIDGWRLDQAYQVPVGAWGEIRKAVEEASDAVTYQNANGDTVHPLGYMVGEIWKGATEISSQGYGTAAQPGLCSAFNFPLRYNLVQTLAVEESGAGGRDATHLDAGMDWNLAYPPHAVPNNFLGNHDLVRFGDLLQRGHVAQPTDDSYWQRHALAWAFLAAQSGPLTLYYGEEIGDELPGFDQKVDCANDGGVGARAGLCDDHVSRTSGKVDGIPGQVGEAAFTLSARQQALHDAIRALMQLRDQHPALYAGTRTHIEVPTAQLASVYVDHKATDSEALLVVINTGTTAQTLSLSGSAIGSEGTLTDLISAETISPASGHYSLTVPALGYRFLTIDSPSANGPATTAVSLTGTGELARCDLPDATGVGPIGEAMYIRGNYTGGDNFNATPADRQFHYKGNNLYQVVVDEPSATSYGFKFAAADWSPEYAVENSAPVKVGQAQNLAVASGPGTESSVTLPQPGRYVFSFRINADQQTGEMMVSLCP